MIDMATIVQDLSKDEVFSKDNFYRPLAVTGYLTPLQRKKLREKRGLLSPVSPEPNESKKPVKSRLIKRKREIKDYVPSKQDKRTKHKEPISQIQCSAAKVICQTKSDLKEKKFFKSSSPGRLEKANFCMPFIYKKNLFTVIDKTIKENNLHLKKYSSLKKKSCDLQSSQDDVDKSRKNVVTPCIVKINSNFCDINEDSSHTELTDDMTKHAQSIFDFDWPSDEELLKRQEEARANFKKQKILKESIDDKKEKEQQVIYEPVQKLYPIFYVASRKQSNSQQDNKRKQKYSLKRLKESSSGGEQMMIDAGQKRFGATICSTCNMIYSIAVEEDETLHSNYHDTYLINLKFPGWKEENVVGEYVDGRIIMIRENDPTFKIKKVEDVLVVANRDLGFSSSSLPSKPDLTFLLFISNTKQVAGCVVAEPISQASRVMLAENTDSLPEQKEVTWRIGNWYSSTETFPAVCGVNRIWVAHNYRRKKVASRMVDCLRCHFIYGHVVGIRELAFTDPSPDGREFAASYTGTDNFLVYK